MSETTAASRNAVRVERRDAVAEVVLTGPGKANAMGPDFFREMPEVFAELDADDSVRAVIVRGDGKHFSAGLDIPAMMEDLGPLVMGENLAAQRTRLLAFIQKVQRAASCVAESRLPVVAAISGACIGGGVDLVSACDVRICSADARFSVREVRVAIVADLGSLQRLPRIIGDGHARQLALTGEDIDAKRAREIGLVNDVHDTPESLLEAARALAGRIAENPPLVVQGIKRVMNDTASMSVSDGLRHVALWNSAFLQSQDLGEAMSAFIERRPPRFTGT